MIDTIKFKLNRSEQAEVTIVPASSHPDTEILAGRAGSVFV